MIDKGEKKAGFEPKEDIWSWFRMVSQPPQPQETDTENEKKGGEDNDE